MPCNPPCNHSTWPPEECFLLCCWQNAGCLKDAGSNLQSRGSTVATNHDTDDRPARLASALDGEEVADLEKGDPSACGDEAESLAAWARAAASLQPDGTRLPACRCQVTPSRCAACTDEAGCHC